MISISKIDEVLTKYHDEKDKVIHCMNGVYPADKRTDAELRDTLRFCRGAIQALNEAKGNDGG